MCIFGVDCGKCPECNPPVPDGGEKLECYRMPGEIVVLGDPDGDEDHNCDAMGCGIQHVLYRFQI